jgi:hypothetical protein
MKDVCGSDNQAIEEVLRRFGMEEASTVRTPLEVGQAYMRAGEVVSDETPYSELC